MQVEPGLTVLVGEDGCGTTTYLRGLHDPPRTVLMTQPPGDEWQDHDVATHAMDAPHLVGSPRERREEFSAALKAVGLKVTTRYSLGSDIAAACGQLVRQEHRLAARTVQTS